MKKKSSLLTKPSTTSPEIQQETSILNDVELGGLLRNKLGEVIQVINPIESLKSSFSLTFLIDRISLWNLFPGKSMEQSLNPKATLFIKLLSLIVLFNTSIQIFLHQVSFKMPIDQLYPVFHGKM